MTKTSFVKNGRQASPDIDGIREDHRKRYQFAIDYGKEQGVDTVIDIGTGTGYGAWMMAKAGFKVIAYEIDPGAIDFGEQHYSHPNLVRVCADIADLNIQDVDMVTGFEIIEHTTSAPRFLQVASEKAKHLVISVPNEDVVPFEQSKHRQHVRHYTPDQLWSQLDCCGWEVENIGCQIGKHEYAADVIFDTTHGRTLIAVATAK